MSECRLCLRSEPSIYIFDEVKTLPEKIWNCCQLTVIENDGLSDQICFSCEVKLESFNEFKCVCEKSEAFLKEQHAQRINIKIEYSDNASEGSNALELSCNEFEIKEEIPCEEDFLMETVTTETECLLEEKRSNKPKSIRGTIKHKNPKKKIYIKTKCEICGKVLKSSLQRHMRSVHSDYLSSLNATPSEFIPVQIKKSDDIKNEEPFLYTDSETTCNICGKVLKSSSLQRHMLGVHKKKQISLKKIYRCNVCNKVILYPNKHLLEDHNGEKEHELLQYHYECSACNGMKLDNYIDGENHMKTVHNVDYRKHLKTKEPCRVCGQLFGRNLMKRHVDARHSESSLKRKEDQKNIVHRCDICNKELTTKHSLKRHMYVMHNSSDTFECDLCHKVFNCKRKIFLHMKRHVYDKSRYRFGCDQCDYKTDINSKLRRHVLSIHMNVKPHQCSVCGKMFKSITNYKDHMKNHEDRYYFECDHCGKKFKCRQSIVSHMMSHLQIKRYQCNICNKKLSTKAVLKCHMYLHTGENPYSCKLCDKRFKQRCNLKSHLRHFHKMSQVQL